MCNAGFSAVQCNAMHYSAVQCSAMQCSAAAAVSCVTSGVRWGRDSSIADAISPRIRRGHSGNVDLDADNNCLGAGIFGKGDSLKISVP